MDATHSSQRTILHFIYYLHFDLSKHRNCVMMPRSLGSQTAFVHTAFRTVRFGLGWYYISFISYSVG